jgi:hypothetical protein
MKNRVEKFTKISDFYMEFLIACLDLQADFKGTEDEYQILKAKLFFKMAAKNGLRFDKI